MKLNKISVPSPKKEYVISFDNLAGGINLRDLDVKLPSSESPEMKNLIWKDGALNSRDGQIWLDDTERGTGFALHRQPWQGCLIYHAGDKLYAYDLEAETSTQIESGVPQIRGTFFEYDGYLYYKTVGYFKRIDELLQVSAVPAYTPVIVINAAPANGSGDLYQPENRYSSYKTVWYNAVENVKQYHLPVNAEDVSEVTVDGIVRTDWTYAAGIVTFTTAPPVTDPPTNNTVHITYKLTNSGAMNSVMNCRFAEVYGGTGSLCIVMAGCAEQPNAYFWNGNDNLSMNPGYWPMEQYQFAGDVNDRITAFGRQQNFLAVFKEHSVGRTTMSTENIGGRLYIDMPFIPINAGTGCDRPWTVQVVQNNLVWASSEQGVFMLSDLTEAYECTVIGISSKILPGLKKMLGKGAEAVAFNDGTHYLLACGGEVFAWNYLISSYSNPSWFYFTEVKAVAFSKDEQLYHLDDRGRITQFLRVFSDYDEPIHKLYRFATQIFGGYDCLKNVKSILVSTRSDTSSVITITYLSDYEQRKDLTDIVAYTNNLVPRNLSYRDLSGNLFSFVFRRKPKCLHVRHFSMTFENNETGHDMSIVSAQIFFNYQGRERGNF